MTSLRGARRHSAVGLRYPQPPAPNCARSRRGAWPEEGGGSSKAICIGGVARADRARAAHLLPSLRAKPSRTATPDHCYFITRGFTRTLRVFTWRPISFPLRSQITPQRPLRISAPSAANPAVCSAQPPRPTAPRPSRQRRAASRGRPRGRACARGGADEQWEGGDKSTCRREGVYRFLRGRQHVRAFSVCSAPLCCRAALVVTSVQSCAPEEACGEGEALCLRPLRLFLSYSTLHNVCAELIAVKEWEKKYMEVRNIFFFLNFLITLPIKHPSSTSSSWWPSACMWTLRSLSGNLLGFRSLFRYWSFIS